MANECASIQPDRDRLRRLERVMVDLQRRMREKFFGKMIIRVESGQIVLVTVEENIKIDDL